MPVCDSTQVSLCKLLHASYVTVLGVSEDDLSFFERLVDVTPNLNRLRISFDNLCMIIRHPQNHLCQILSRKISQLEIQLENLWFSLDIRTYILNIIRIFTNVRFLSISISSASKNLLHILKDLLKHLLKCQQNLLCIIIDNTSTDGFEFFKRHGGFDLIQTWFSLSVKPSSHLELKSSSMTIWL